jgi:hypothetical protein
MLVMVSFTYMRNEADCVGRTLPVASASADGRACEHISPRRHQLKEHQLLPRDMLERSVPRGPGTIYDQSFLRI